MVCPHPHDKHLGHFVGDLFWQSGDCIAMGIAELLRSRFVRAAQVVDQFLSVYHADILAQRKCNSEINYLHKALALSLCVVYSAFTRCKHKYQENRNG